MTTTIDKQLADAEQKYRQLHEQAEAQRRADEAAEAKRQANRHAAEPDFWQQWKQGHRDRHTGATQLWEAFAAEVRAGRPGITEYATYRAAVQWRHRDMLDVRRWHYQRHEAEYQHRAGQAQDLHAKLSRLLVGTGSTDARTAENMGITVDRFRELREQALADADHLLGRQHQRTNTGVLEALRGLPEYVGDKPTGNHALAVLAQEDPEPATASYSRAVDLVTRQMVDEQVQQQAARRDEQREEFLAERE